MIIIIAASLLNFVVQGPWLAVIENSPRFLLQRSRFDGILVGVRYLEASDDGPPILVVIQFPTLVIFEPDRLLEHGKL